MFQSPSEGRNQGTLVRNLRSYIESLVYGGCSTDPDQHLVR